MKKRYLIPGIAAVSIAILASLASHGRHIRLTCVPGNADYEAGTGLCSSRNAQAAAQDHANAAAQPVVQAPAAQPNRIGVLARESELMGPMPTDPAALHQWLDRQCEITLEMQEASANAVSAHEMGRMPYCTAYAQMNDDLRANGIDPDSL